MLWLFVRNVILKIMLEMGSSKGSNVTDVKAVDIGHIVSHLEKKP
jgi:hypothetical protein